MARYKVRATSVATVEEEWTLDIPDGVDFDPLSWSSWLDLFAQHKVEVIDVQSLSVEDALDRRDRTVERAMTDVTDVA